MLEKLLADPLIPAVIRFCTWVDDA